MSRYKNKIKNFNQWVDIVTEHINTISWYSTNKVDIDVGEDKFGEMSWDDLMDEFKKEYALSGNVYKVVQKYGHFYNTSTGWTVIGGYSDSPNKRNVGCSPKGDLKLCWSAFEEEGRWDNTQKEGIGPMTSEDSETLRNQIYPSGSIKD